MKNRLFLICTIGAAAIAVSTSSCKMLSGKKKSGTLPKDGQLHGVAPTARWNLTKPPGMVYIPPGTFHMGPSDQDINYAYTARNKQVSISGFWMDATEITNNEYRQFTNWVRDSIAAKLMGYVKQDQNGNEMVDWTKTIKWGDKATIERIDAIIVTPDNRIFGKKELDAKKIVYQSEIFDYKAASQNRDVTIPRSAFIIKQQIPVYPDSLCWVRDFAYSYNEPMHNDYFWHQAYGDYPVVGVSWNQAKAFCAWRTMYKNAYIKKKKGRDQINSFRLPTEAEWEYAARGGLEGAAYPWGGPYSKNDRGCFMANFKPNRGDYAADGALYTVEAKSYEANDFNLYNMSGNVSEWTESSYFAEAYEFTSTMNPHIADKTNQRKVVRGGSWKDVGYMLQVSTRDFEYADSARSYIGFRTVQDYMGTGSTTNRPK